MFLAALVVFWTWPLASTRALLEFEQAGGRLWRELCRGRGQKGQAAEGEDEAFTKWSKHWAPPVCWSVVRSSPHGPQGIPRSRTSVNRDTDHRPGAKTFTAGQHDAPAGWVSLRGPRSTIRAHVVPSLMLSERPCDAPRCLASGNGAKLCCRETRT